MIPIIQNCPGCFQTLCGHTFFVNDGFFRLDKDQYHFEDINKVWMSSIAMCLYILDNKDVFNGKEVLELGAGIGLPSQYVRTHTFAKSVTSSDIADIDWEDLDPEDVRRFDVIIAADCMYRCTHKAFIQTLQKYIKPGGVIVLFNAIRPEIEEALYEIKSIWPNAETLTKSLLVENTYSIELYHLVINFD